MSIKKQEFYEGAALHILARTGTIRALSYKPPFFLLNGKHQVLVKYSTRGRSPWGFTFTQAEQGQITEGSKAGPLSIALVCGHDGIASFDAASFMLLAAEANAAVRISCQRLHGEMYEVSGPSGSLPRKVSPSNWQKVLL